MCSCKITTAIFAAVVVVCTALLIIISGAAKSSVAVRAGLGLATIIAVSYLYNRANAVSDADADAAGTSGVVAGTGSAASPAAVAEAIENALTGRRADRGVVSGVVADAIDKVADKVEGLAVEVADLSPADELTALVKEDVFNNILWREYNRSVRYKTPISMALVEIDNIERIREAGGATADKLLREVAGVILQIIRETDVAARYGRDQFAIIMPETAAPGAAEFAARLSRAVEARSIAVNGGGSRLSVSVGTSSIPDEGTKTAPELVERSATALKAAKGKSGGRA